MPNLDIDTSKFKNPEGYWNYSGPYIIELVDDYKKDDLPDSVVVMGNIIFVKDGKIQQSMGGIDIYYVEDKVFALGYKDIKKIIKCDLLWVNYYYRNNK